MVTVGAGVEILHRREDLRVHGVGHGRRRESEEHKLHGVREVVSGGTWE